MDFSTYRRKRNLNFFLFLPFFVFERNRYGTEMFLALMHSVEKTVLFMPESGLAVTGVAFSAFTTNAKSSSSFFQMTTKVHVESVVFYHHHVLLRYSIYYSRVHGQIGLSC